MYIFENKGVSYEKNVEPREEISIKFGLFGVFEDEVVLLSFEQASFFVKF